MPSENVTTVQRAMSNGLQTIAKRFSAFLTVIYFLDAATLSSGKYASLHGRLSQSKRDPPSPCHLRCVSDVSKVISFEECVTSCQEKLSSHRDTMHKNRKKRDSSSIRQQRSAEYQNECMTSAVQSRNKPLPVKIRSVEFKEKDIDVVWEKKNSSKTDYNWSAYAFIYKVQCDRCIDDSVDMCKIIPKNQTDYSVPLAYWEKPEHLFAAVVTFPFSKKAHVSLQTFSPYAPARRIPMLTEAKKGDTVKLVSSIVGGIVAGVVMLLLLFALVRKRPCQGSTPRMPPPEPPRLEEKKDEKELYYACYYPESDAFRDEVASIVNYFRQNGYNVIMDVMVSTEITSQGPTRWGESQIRKANKVLVFLSPGLINLALDGCEGFQSQDTNRVWIELEALRDLYTRNRSASKMVCITLPDMPLTSEPLPLWAKVIYKWPDDALEILKRLNDRPKILAI